MNAERQMVESAKPAANAMPDDAQPSWLRHLIARLTPGQAVILIIAISAVIRLAATSQVGIETDSTYSAVIARQPSWSYFDHPPMHYLLLRWSSWLLGTDFGLAARLPFMLLFAASTWLMYRVTAIVFGEWPGFWAAAALNLCGIFTLAYSHFSVPDGPLFFFLLLAARVLVPVLFGANGTNATLYWIGAGLAGGGALLSKYSAVFVFFGLFLFIVTTPSQRHWLTKPGPWLAAAIVALMFLPVIWWNWQHDWISFSFQGRRAVPADSANVLLLFESIGMQMLFLLPWLYVPMAFVFLKALLRGPRHPRHWFFACLAAPILIFPLLTLFRRGLPHWTLPGWLFVFPLLGAAIAELDERWRKHARRIAVGTAAFLVAAGAALIVEARTGIYARWASQHYPDAQIAVRDPMIALYDWQELGPALRQRGLLADDVKFIAAFHWHNAARIGYVLGRDYPVLCIGADTRHFRFLHDNRDYAGMTGLLIDLPEYIAQDSALIDAQFERRERLAPVILTRGGRPALELRVERVTGFKPLPK